MLTEDSTIFNNWPELAQAVARPVRLDYRVAAMHLVRTEANDPEVREALLSLLCKHAHQYLPGGDLYRIRPGQSYIVNNNSRNEGVIGALSKRSHDRPKECLDRSVALVLDPGSLAYPPQVLLLSGIRAYYVNAF